VVLWDVMLYNLVDILTRPLDTKVSAQHYIPEDTQFHEHDCKNLKSHTDMNHIYVSVVLFTFDLSVFMHITFSNSKFTVILEFGEVILKVFKLSFLY